MAILKNLFTLALVAFVFLLITQFSFGQARIGTIQGTVKDPTGALVPDATVIVTQPVTGYKQTAQTDQQGTFKLVNVPFNTYKIRAEAPGFQASEQSADLESTVPL